MSENNGDGLEFLDRPRYGTLPPSPKGRRTERVAKLRRQLEMLRDGKPGRWAVVAREPKNDAVRNKVVRSIAQQISADQYSWAREIGRFEAASRTAEDGTLELWVRYLGPR